jgi:hypothetical protein
MVDVGPPFGGSEEVGGGSRLVVVFVPVEVDVAMTEDEDGGSAAVEVATRQEPDITATAFCTREGEHEFCMQYLAEEENVLQRQLPVFWVRWLIFSSKFWSELTVEVKHCTRTRYKGRCDACLLTIVNWQIHICECRGLQHRLAELQLEYYSAKTQLQECQC